MTAQPDIIWNEQCLGIRIGEQVCTYLKKHDAEYQRLQNKILELTEKYPVIETFMESNQSISLTEEEHKAVHRYFQLESEKEMIEEQYHFYMGQAQMILQETYTLANGIAIPKLGLGTWFIDNNKAAQAVRTAVELGYRLIDTAQAYGNERGVGEGIRTCGLKREELFVASKVAAEHKTYEDAARSIDETLEKMGLTYLDQMLIHSPQPWREFRAEKRYFQENRAVWRGLEDAQAAGKVRVIGVSNFLRDDLENLLTGCRVRPAVNQLLLHIAGTDLPLLDYCTRQDIRVEAYSPIAHGEALKNPAITAMAEKYGVSVPQLCIRYVLQLGAVALPKTADPGHMRSNAAVDFAISPEDMETLRSMEHLTDYGDYNGFPVFSGKPLA